jgi:hypothetical protein
MGMANQKSGLKFCLHVWSITDVRGAKFYGLSGMVIQSRLGARFSVPVQTGSGPHPAFCTVGTWSLPGVKPPRHGVDHSFPSSTEVKERVEACLCFPFWPSRPLIRWTSLLQKVRSRESAIVFVQSVQSIHFKIVQYVRFIFWRDMWNGDWLVLTN